MIEERNIVFLEDGADINKLTETTPPPVGPQESIPFWKRFPKKAVVNVNRYIAKYNFEIARKLKGTKFEVVAQKAK